MSGRLKPRRLVHNLKRVGQGSPTCRASIAPLTRALAVSLFDRLRRPARGTRSDGRILRALCRLAAPQAPRGQQLACKGHAVSRVRFA